MNRTKYVVAVLSFFLLFSLAFAQPPECYHSYTEIQDTLFSLQNAYPEYVRVDTIGYSLLHDRPIYAVLVSDSAQYSTDRPTVAFFGQVHAEEIQGIELCIRGITQLASRPNAQYPQTEFIQRRRTVNTWFVPTANPDGLGVVHGDFEDCNGDDIPEWDLGPDVTYRKNMRITHLDPHFRYELGMGGDLSGVDLNRNFDINYYHGEGLLEGQHQEQYDYYRGEYAFSEPETQAIRDFVKIIQPLLSVTYHTSRSGLYSEKIMYPWNWGDDDDRLAPDQNLLDNLANRLSLEINYTQLYDHCIPIHSTGRNGKMHDWMYAAGNWTNFQCELSDIQPAEDEMNMIIEGNLPAMWFLIDYARLANTVETPKCHLRVRAYDENNDPLVAEVFIPQRYDGYFQPRYTSAEFGTYRQIIEPGSYTVVVSAFGYETQTFENVIVNGSTVTGRTVNMVPIPQHQLALDVVDEIDPEVSVNYTLILNHAWGSDTTMYSAGENTLSLPEGEYTLQLWKDNYYPTEISLNLTDNQSLTVPMASMPSENPHGWHYNFEWQTIPEFFTTVGDFDWGVVDREAHSGDFSIESHPGDFIPVNASGYLEIPISVQENETRFVFQGWRAFELEPDDDFCYVLASVNSVDWDTLEVLNGFSRWMPFYYDLSDYSGNTIIYLRWLIETDVTDTDRGLFLDDLGFNTSLNWVDVAEEPLEVPCSWQLKPAYPNPFNPSTTIEYEVASNALVKITVFDILGRTIAQVVNRDHVAGQYAAHLDLSNQASGMYFVRMQSRLYSSTQKIVLMK